MLTGAIYQFNRFLIMLDLSPYFNNPRAPLINENLLSRFAGTDQIEMTDIGFACIYN